MLIALAIALGLIGAKLLGADLTRLAALKFRGTWLVFLALAGQLAIFTRYAPTIPEPAEISVHLASYLLLLLFLVLNIRLRGLWITATGFACNTLVIFANGGRMPVSADAWIEGGGKPLTGEADVYNNVAVADTGTRLRWLGDSISLPHQVPLASAVSIGDILLIVGTIAFVYRACGPADRYTARQPTA